MAIALSDVTATLKEVIQPYVKDNLPKETILLDQMKKNVDVEFFSNNFYVPMRTSRHSGVTNLANGSSKLRSGKAAFGRANVGVKILTGTFDIEKLTIDATSNSKAAVVAQLSEQGETLTSDFARNVNRQLYADGIGIVAEVVGSTSGTAFTIGNVTASNDDARSLDNYGSVNGDIAAAKYLTPGQAIAVGSAATGTAVISAIVSGTTVQTTGAVASAANNSLYLVDGDFAGAGTSEVTGIRSALSSSTGTSTYANVARSTIGWTPQLDQTAEALSLSRMETVYLSMMEYARKGDRVAIFMNKTPYKKYGDILTAMRRSANTTDLLGGWTGLEFAVGNGKVGVFLDYDVPDGEVLFINLDTWTMCQVSDMSWAENPDNEGSLLRRADYLTYQATMVWFMNVICQCPAANGRLTRKTA